MPTAEQQSVVQSLQGRAMPSIALPCTDGSTVDLAKLGGLSVLYCYPRTSPANGAALPGWDTIPGAKGCTPQSCAFGDLHSQILAAGADRVFGLSTQDTEYQNEFRTRKHLPFHILSDAELALANAIGLPILEASGLKLLRRLTMIVQNGRITHALYPVEQPADNAADVLNMLRA